MRRTILMTVAAILGLAAMMLSGCRYKDLCYDHHHDTEHNFVLKLTLNLDIDIDIDTVATEEDHTRIKEPTYMVVCFYDTLTGSMKTLEYVGAYGGPLHVNPGTYDMVVYAFDTEWTQVRGEGNIKDLEAYTSDITASKAHLLALFDKAEEDDTSAPGPIIYTPDHLLVTRKRVEIPPYSLEEQVITIEATAATVVETYSFRVKNVTGVEYVSSVDAFITNQSRANYIGRGRISPKPATIYFPMRVDRKDRAFKCTFNTFGKLPGESKSYLNVVLTDSEGKVHTLVTDITDQFGKKEHTIIIEDSVVIPPPSGGGEGGIAPTVDEWEEENHDVAIG